MTKKNTPFGEGATNKKRLNNLILSQKIVEIQYPKFIPENALKIECTVWDERIMIAKTNYFSFRPSFQIAIKEMTNTRQLLASGGLRK